MLHGILICGSLVHVHLFLHVITCEYHLDSWISHDLVILFYMTQFLALQAAAERVRRNSTDSIGNTDDLLHPNSAANKDGEDVPDFWDKISQFSVRMRKDARYFFQVWITWSGMIA